MFEDDVEDEEAAFAAREAAKEKAKLTDLILDLSLTAAYPLSLKGIDAFRGAAATTALAFRTQNMAPKELRELVYTLGPLLGLLSSDITSPLAPPASTGIRCLLGSHVCIVEFVQLNGITILGHLFDQILTGAHLDLQSPSPKRTIVENLAICYRELSKWYPKQIVTVGSIRHCIRLLSYGDLTIKAIAVTVLSTLSDDLDIVKKMFSNGAIKPILRLCSYGASNSACLLAGLGCVLQFSRIPEIGSKLVRQGALAVLEEALNIPNDVLNFESIREKALMSLAWLTQIADTKRRIATPPVLEGMRRDLLYGRKLCQVTVMQMMINLRYAYPEELAFNTSVRDKIVYLMSVGPWIGRNLVTKLSVLVYRDDANKLYFVQHGALEAIFQIIEAKSLDLQEVPMVALLSYCAHPDVPEMFMDKGGLQVLVKVLYAIDDVIRDLAVVLLKGLALYDRPRVEAVIPPEKHHLFVPDPNSDPVVYGSEYGGMIQEYLQTMLANRRAGHYLLAQFKEGEVERYGLTEAELDSYQTTFMLLDVAAVGFLTIDELKVIMVIMGEKLDAEELKLLIDEFDEDKSGVLNFREFSIMMKGWKTRFGTGLNKAYNETMQRGAIGKGSRAFSAWWNKDAIAKAEIAKMKEEKAAEREKRQKQMEKYMGNEKIKVQRELETALKQQELAELYGDDDDE